MSHESRKNNVWHHQIVIYKDIFFYLAKDSEDVGRRMSSVFLAKVEMKEKEEKEKLKNTEVAGGNKESKRTVIWIHTDMSLSNYNLSN